MRIRLPSKKVRERFLLVYELRGCQEAVNFLTKHYGVRPMRIILNGRRVGNGDFAVYYDNRAYFTRKGLNKRTVLHELYHHLVEKEGLEMSMGKEEKEADVYSKKLLELRKV
jgi:hypothetical protein